MNEVLKANFKLCEKLYSGTSEKGDNQYQGHSIKTSI